MAGADPVPAAAAAAAWSRRRWTVISDREQRSWNEIERSYAEEAETMGGGDPGPPGRESSRSDGFHALAIGAVGLALMSVLIGAWVAGLVIIATSALGWVLWRWWDDIGDACAGAVVPVDDRVADDASSQHRRRTPGAN